MSATIEGELQSLGAGGFEGWAWDSEKPYDPVEVEILCNDEVVAKALADGFSLELVKRRKGNGTHAFSILPERLPKAGYPLRILARVLGQQSPLPGQILIKTPAELVEALPKSLIDDYEGYVDGVIDGAVVGWVVNTTLPEEIVEVELLDGDRVIATGSAGRFRQDVERRRAGGGNSGFELALPYDLLDGRLHNLRVRVVDTRYELQNGPIVFGPGAANALVKEVLRLREATAALEKKMSGLPTDFDTFSREIIGRFEALYCLQRDAFEREILEIKKAALGIARLSDPAPLPPLLPPAAKDAASGTAQGSPVPPITVDSVPEEPAHPLATASPAAPTLETQANPVPLSVVDGGSPTVPPETQDSLNLPPPATGGDPAEQVEALADFHPALATPELVEEAEPAAKPAKRRGAKA